MDQRETAIFYRRILHPGVNLLNHANTLGVKLRSKTFVTDYPIRQGHLRKGSPRRSGPQHVEVYGRAGSAHRREQGHHPTPTYIHDVVVPLNSYTAASFSQERTSAETPRSLFSQNPSRSKSAGLGPVPFSRSRKGSAKLCTVKTTRSRPLSVHADSIYDSTSSLRAQEYGGSLNSSRQNANDSGQAIRFGSEMENRAQCQTRKRISEIRPHRVDRMYYMSGAPLHIQPKYHVEDEELTHLREISRSRKSSKHYGRGLSGHKGDNYQPLEDAVPNQGTSNGTRGTEMSMAGSGVVAITEPNGEDGAKPEDLDSVSDLMSARQTPALARNADDDSSPHSPEDATPQIENLTLQDQDEQEDASLNAEQNDQLAFGEHEADQNVQLDDKDSGVDDESVKEEQNEADEGYIVDEVSDKQDAYNES